MICKTPKLRLQKCVNIAQQLRNNKIDISNEDVQYTIDLVRNLDHLVLPRFQKSSNKKKSRKRVPLSSEQLDFLRSTFTENFLFLLSYHF